MLSVDSRPEESRQTDERSEAFQLLEYVQKLICAIGPIAPKAPPTDEQFEELASATRDVFQPLKLDYFLCRSGKLRGKEDYDPFLDEYAVATEMIWLSVRGQRYLSHETEYVGNVLLPHSGLLGDLYGIDSATVSAGVASILSSLTRGVGDLAEDLQAFQRDTMNGIEREDPRANLPPHAAMEMVVQKNNWQARRDSVFGRLLGTDLFDVGKLTGWPDEFVADLSLAVGEDAAFADGSAESSWPTRFSLTHFSPFVRIGGKSCCFHIYGLTDRLYRAIENAVRRKAPRCGERWNRGQKRASETLTAQLFARLLPDARSIANAYYWAKDNEYGEVKWTERDLIILYDDQLLVIEIKAGRYTHRPPARNIRDHLESLKLLIETAALQATRFVRQLEVEGAVVIYNSKREPLVEVGSANIRRIIRCVVTLDQIDDIASRAEDLKDLGIDIGPHPVWIVSLSELLVIADVFSNPLMFVDYLAERMRAFASPTCHVTDELDHLGLYLAHNRYVQRAEQYAPMESVGWIGYRDVFDRYYAAVWQGESGTLPKQEMPAWMEDVLRFFARSGKPGRTRAAELLLSMSGEARTEFAALVEKSWRLQNRQRRPRPVSCGGDVRLTVSVSQEGAYEATFDTARDHALVVLTLQDEADRLVVWLQFSEDSILLNVKWAFVTPADASKMDGDTLAERVGRLRASRET